MVMIVVEGGGIFVVEGGGIFLCRGWVDISCRSKMIFCFDYLFIGLLGVYKSSVYLVYNI